MTNLANQFTEIVRANPNKTAIFWDGSEYSFGYAYSVAKCLSNRLKDQFELQSGDRVALWLKNCPEFVFSLFGVLLGEGVVVSINSFLTPDEVGYIVEDCGAKVIISETSMAAETAKLVKDIPKLNVIDVESLSQTESNDQFDFSSLQQSPEDLALIICTSGTTGKPKGAMLSNQNLMYNVKAIVEAADIVPPIEPGDFIDIQGETEDREVAVIESSNSLITFDYLGSIFGKGANATANLTSGRVESVSVTAGGSGYTSRPNVRIDSISGFDAQIRALVGVSGVVISNPGSGYQNPSIAVETTVPDDWVAPNLADYGEEIIDPEIL